MANENAIVALNKTKQSVIQKVDDYIEQKQLILPPNYSFGTAINQFQLAIQDDSKIMACSQTSIAKAMLDMVVLGLNISKNQCYVIPYGSQAKLHVSYEGKAAIAKRVDPTIEDITGRVVKAGEEFDFEDLPNGFSKIIKHKRTLESMNSKDILAAYATITYKDGKEPKSLIMTFERIKKSWSMSQMRPVNADGSLKSGTTHEKFSEDMAVRTVISAITKPIISQSDDGSLFSNTIQTVEIEEAAAQARETIEQEQGNGELIDFDTPDAQIDAIDVEFTPVDEVVGNIVDKLEKGVVSGEQDSFFGAEREDWHDGV